MRWLFKPRDLNPATTEKVETMKIDILKMRADNNSMTLYYDDEVENPQVTTYKDFKAAVLTFGTPACVNIDALPLDETQRFLTEFFHTDNILIVTDKDENDSATVTISSTEDLLHGTVPTQQEIDVAPRVQDPFERVFGIDKQVVKEFATTVTTANDKQIDGDHYKTKAIQPWDYALANNLDPLQFTVVKYITRYKTKHDDPLIDLRKTVHTLEKMIEVEIARQFDQHVTAKQ